MTRAGFCLRKMFPESFDKVERVIDRREITKVSADESRWKFDGTRTDLDRGLRFAGQPSKAVFNETSLELRTRISQSRNDAKITRFYKVVSFYM